MEPKGDVLVQSESGDWYIIPFERLDDWDESGFIDDNPPNWAIYVQSPRFVILHEWSSSLR